MNSAESFLTLGMESSCDDTAVAVLRGPRKVESELLSEEWCRSSPPAGTSRPSFHSRRRRFDAPG